MSGRVIKQGGMIIDSNTEEFTPADRKWAARSHAQIKAAYKHAEVETRLDQDRTRLGPNQTGHKWISGELSPEPFS